MGIILFILALPFILYGAFSIGVISFAFFGTIGWQVYRFVKKFWWVFWFARFA